MSIQGIELHDLIKELAQRTGKPTQDAQAKKLGISDTSLAAYLAGKQVPRESTLVTMLDAAGIPQGEHRKYLKIRQMADAAQRARVIRESPHVASLAEEELPEEPPVVTKPRRAKLPIWAWAGVPVLLGLVVWGAIALLPSRSQAPSATAVVVSSPPAVPLQCSLVNVLSSPVYVEIGDREPVKSKVHGDRVRTLPVPRRTGSDGVIYQAVALPNHRDSPNGVGWMRAADLKPDPRQCAGLGQRP